MLHKNAAILAGMLGFAICALVNGQQAKFYLDQGCNGNPAGLFSFTRIHFHGIPLCRSQCFPMLLCWQESRSSGVICVIPSRILVSAFPLRGTAMETGALLRSSSATHSAQISSTSTTILIRIPVLDPSPSNMVWEYQFGRSCRAVEP